MNNTLERQLSERAFLAFSHENGAVDLDETKIKFAPLTNCGFKAKFAELYNSIAASS